MTVIYYPEHDGEKIDEANYSYITGYDLNKLLSFTGIHGYTDNYIYEISGTYPILRIYVSHAGYELQRSIYFDEARVKNDYFEVKIPRNGIGRKIFAAQVAALTLYGFENIRVHALGGEGCEDFNGHITWAKFGFSMDTGSEILKFKKLINAHNRKENTVNELVKSKNGSAFWSENGFSWNGIFLLAENSVNQKILKDYLDLYS